MSFGNKVGIVIMASVMIASVLFAITPAPSVKTQNRLMRTHDRLVSIDREMASTRRSIGE